MRVEEERQARREAVDVEARIDSGLHVGDAVGQRECHLLHGRRSGLADVVTADGDGVEPRHLRRAVGEGVGGQAHAGVRREDVVAARHVLLEDVVLDGAAQLVGGHALALAHQAVEQQQHGGRRVDGHAGRDVAQRDAIEHPRHVVHRVDGHAHATHLAKRTRVVGVHAQLGGQVEGHRQAGRAVCQQVAEPLVGLFRSGETRVLARGPRPLAVHGLVGPAGERVGTRLPEALIEHQCVNVRLVVDGLDLNA